MKVRFYRDILENFFELTSIRWSSSQSLGLPCLRYSRDPAGLRRRSLVLGLAAHQADRSRHHQWESCCRLLGDYSHHRSHRHPHVDCWLPPLGGLAGLLPPSSRPGSLVLHLSFPPEDHRMVLCHRHDTKLLALCTLRKELGIPLELQPRSSLADCVAHHLVFHSCLGCIPMALRHPVKGPFLDLARLRDWPWSTKMVSNPLGYLQYRTVRPMGRWPRSQCSRRTQLVALARRPRRPARRRIRHDPAPNSNTHPHRLHSRRSPSPRLHSYHPRSSDCAQQDRTRRRLS